MPHTNHDESFLYNECIMYKPQSTILTVLFIAAIGLLIAGFVISQKKDTTQAQDIKPVSTYDVNPSPNVSPTVVPEPEIMAWRAYGNESYNFSIEVPDGWRVVDYSSLYPSGGTVIAFSPDPLPCKTCTYFRDGFFSIKIYNERTDPIFYTNFKQRMQGLGKKKEYLQFQVDGKTGVYFSNIAAVENQGWVYEFSYDKEKGSGDAVASKIFQHVLSSFKFTKLTFEN